MTQGWPWPGREMVAAMDPNLVEGDWCFVASNDGDGTAAAFAAIHEEEGTTLVMPASLAAAEEPRYRRITLRIQSALDSVGLTAAVSGELAARGIACNVIAGNHHDHLFVPAAQAEAALAALSALQERAGAAEGSRFVFQTPEDRPIYRLLTGKDDRAFCERVSEALELGWRLHGSPTLEWDHEAGEMRAAQAVVWHEANVVKR